ncbi:Serine/threonine-protein phosphatase 6 regulatory subunit 1 [Myotis davidii]|uniref:Lysoplasmalogenase TMEM86B n=1 Tax=Myotis davidii TaxID=225400 RepID=L5LBY9_MYODS|nr:Serine/threonine-protein phosphatase 6 regulatory subunit 1 [Myotis davidii]
MGTVCRIPDAPPSSECLPSVLIPPNTNLLEICYKDRIQQFDDEEEEEGQGSGESDGEDGAWQGSQLARGPHLGQPAGFPSGGSTENEEEDNRRMARGGSARWGALFFAASDSLLSWHTFIQPLTHGRLLIMATYYAAQLFITLSAFQSPKLKTH